MKILLAKRRALGDTVLLSSSIELLARAIPGAEISALVPGAFAPVLDGNPHLRHLWSFEESWLTLLPKIRAERFDHFFQLHASPRTRWLPRLSGARSVHFHYQNSETEQAYGKHPNALEWDGFFFRRIWGEVELPAPLPRIYLTEEEREAGRRLWAPLDPSRVVVLGLGASRATKRWLPAHFARLAELMRDRRELIPALVVGPGEEESLFAGKVIDEMRARGLRPVSGGRGDFFHLAGLSVRSLAGALAGARAYVGSDSGPKHIAVAVGTPTLTLFGPEDPVEWHPYDREAHPVFFLEGLTCRREDEGRWCGIPSCDESSIEKHRCMRDIDPLDVFERMP